VAFGATVVRRATFVRLDSHVPDVVEYLRNAAARVDPRADVQTLQAVQEVGRFRDIRRGLFAGTVVTLLLIGASLLVTAVEQLRDRRRLLAALAAFGTSRATLGWSVLWQTAVPIVLGLILAVAAGLGLGSVLLRMTDQPIIVNWSAVGGIAAVAGAVVLAVTVLTLPALWRLVRPSGLRTE
jgi:predicted lysophospholipase L1 biosynthesis ABC-type transport system permease subunit